MNLFAKVIAGIAIWSVTIFVLAILSTAPEWFWFHYIGTMPYETYSVLAAAIGITAFIGGIASLAAAAGATAYLCGAFTKKPQAAAVTGDKATGGEVTA